MTFCRFSAVGWCSTDGWLLTSDHDWTGATGIVVTRHICERERERETMVCVMHNASMSAKVDWIEQLARLSVCRLALTGNLCSGDECGEEA